MAEHERLLQGAVNLVAMLEKMFETDIKTAEEYVHWYNEWSSMGKPINVALIASQGVRRAHKRVVADKNPPQRIKNWDFKKNPIRWEDQ